MPVLFVLIFGSMVFTRILELCLSGYLDDTATHRAYQVNYIESTCLQHMTFSNLLQHKNGKYTGRLDETPFKKTLGK